MTDIPSWWMKGDWFDVCSCDIACPCEFARPPTNNHCEGVLVYHVREGAYGDLQLDDLTVVLVVQFDGSFWMGTAENIAFGLFIDERGDGRQRQALQRVFSGGAGGFISTMMELMGEPSWVEFAPIGFTLAEDLAHWSAEIAGRVVARAEALPTTPPGARVQLLNPPGSEVGPGQIATWGEATDCRVETREFQWSWPGKSSKHIPFDWTGPT